MQYTPNKTFVSLNGSTTMRLLAMDTATNACSAALWEDGEILAYRFEPMKRGQAERLVPLVQEVLEEAEASWESLDGLTVTIGPGAFTGLRIGLATARAMALAAAKPLVGITTLDAVAEGVPEDERQGRNLLVVLDAKRADAYAQLFGPDLRPLSEPVAALPETLPSMAGDAPLILAGDFAAAVAAHFDGTVPLASGDGLPDARVVARLAAAKGLPETSEPPAPLYIRPPDATIPKNGGKLRP